MHPVMPSNPIQINQAPYNPTHELDLPSYALATTGSRVLAYIIDVAVTFILTVTLIIAVSIATFSSHSDSRPSTTSSVSGRQVQTPSGDDRDWTNSAWFLIFFGYRIACERLGGRTIGKRVMGIRVVNAYDAKDISWGQSIGRNISLFLDLFLFGIPGLISIERSELNQRIGDRLAKSVVIKHGAVPSTPRPPKVAYYQ